ncbi:MULTISPECIES: hypothetical protein [Halobacteriovorax]|nr:MULTISPECIES: hypothetical protein [Halobacteriovorax]AYF44826.1 hypothetical protein BALOs_1826 [Halobacteriovorax sp. BALOs_7]
MSLNIKKIIMKFFRDPDYYAFNFLIFTVIILFPCLLVALTAKYW